MDFVGTNGGRLGVMDGCFSSATVIWGGKPGESYSGGSKLLMLTLGSLFLVLHSPTSISSSILNIMERWSVELWPSCRSLVIDGFVIGGNSLWFLVICGGVKATLFSSYYSCIPMSACWPVAVAVAILLPADYGEFYADLCCREPGERALMGAFRWLCSFYINVPVDGFSVRLRLPFRCARPESAPILFSTRLCLFLAALSFFRCPDPALDSLDTLLRRFVKSGNYPRAV